MTGARLGILSTLLLLMTVNVSRESQSKQLYPYAPAFAASYPAAGAVIFNPFLNPLQSYPRPVYPSIYPYFVGNTGGYYVPRYHHHHHRNWGR